MYRSVSDLSSVVQDFFRVRDLKPLLMLERASDGLSFYEVKDWIGLEAAVYFVSLFTRASVILKRSQFSGVSHPLSNLDPKKVHFCVELNWNSLLHLVLTFVVGKFLCFSMLLSTVFSNSRLVDNEIPNTKIRIFSNCTMSHYFVANATDVPQKYGDYRLAVGSLPAMSIV